MKTTNSVTKETLESLYSILSHLTWKSPKTQNITTTFGHLSDTLSMSRVHTIEPEQ